MSKILLVVGTRPELIKTAPIVHAFRKAGKENLIKVLSTAQHKDMLKKYWHIFDIKPDYELNFLKKGQSLSELTSRAFKQTDVFFKQLKSENKTPKYIVVQGDTTTVFSVGVSAFYHGIKVAHIEAGLRTYDLQNPFPEEFNRRAVSIIADINFTPTLLSSENLQQEGVPQDKIHIVGNTVVDALQFITTGKTFNSNSFTENKLNEVDLQKGKVVLITFHRRENQNDNLFQLISAVNNLAAEYPDFYFVWTLHPNPKIKEHVINSDIAKNKNVILIPPLEYMDILKLMNLSKVILSDSGGIQEEAPSFGVPVMVLRKITERPEGIISKKAFITDVKSEAIILKFRDLIQHFQYINKQNPYGDGKASERIRDRLISSLY